MSLLFQSHIFSFSSCREYRPFSSHLNSSHSLLFASRLISGHSPLASCCLHFLSLSHHLFIYHLNLVTPQSHFLFSFLCFFSPLILFLPCPILQLVSSPLNSSHSLVFSSCLFLVCSLLVLLLFFQFSDSSLVLFSKCSPLVSYGLLSSQFLIHLSHMSLLVLFVPLYLFSSSLSSSNCICFLSLFLTHCRLVLFPCLFSRGGNW